MPASDFDGAPRIAGKGGDPIATLADWNELGGPAGGARQWATGRSAIEEARAWIGLLPLLALLESQEATRGFRPGLVTPEARLALDEYGGNTRNTDVLVCGRAAGGKTLVAVEAKADEPFDRRTVEEAATDPSLPEASNLPARVDRLCELVFGSSRESLNAQARGVRYQLVCGLAGAVLEARREQAAQAVFAVHEFRTDATSDERHAANAESWEELFAALGEPEPASGTLAEVWLPGAEGVRAFAGKATSDLRS